MILPHLLSSIRYSCNIGRNHSHGLSIILHPLGCSKCPIRFLVTQTKETALGMVLQRTHQILVLLNRSIYLLGIIFKLSCNLLRLFHQRGVVVDWCHNCFFAVLVLLCMEELGVGLGLYPALCPVDGGMIRITENGRGASFQSSQSRAWSCLRTVAASAVMGG